MMNRRHLLQSTAALGTLAASGRLFAAPGDTSARQPRFLLVFLRGGYDAMNLLVPTGSSFYYENRRNIAVAREAALPVADGWGLHPALRDTIFPLVGKGEAAFIPFAGTDDSSRSHFETQDSIELGQALQGTQRDFGSGFMNRLATQVGASDAIAFTDQLPLTFRGSAQIGNVSLRNLGKGGVDGHARDLLAGMYRNQPLGPQVQAGFEMRDEVAREMSSETAPNVVGEQKSANRNAVTAKGFEVEARRVARLMRDRYALGFIDVGGWDTHVNQGNASGYLANRFDELGRGLAGFADEMGPEAWKRTVVVVVSEFGRTIRENGNRGTDHGHGSVYWALGGSLAVRGVAGEQVPIEAKSLFQNRDLPVLNEYRSVLARLFQSQYGLSTNALAQVFPGATPSGLQLA